MTWRSAMLIPCAVLLVLSVVSAEEAPRERGERQSSDFQASRLLKQAQDFLAAAEHERGVKMLQTIIEQYPDSFVRYQALLSLGKHYIDVRQEADAIRVLTRIEELKQPETELRGDPLEVYLEAVYLIGIGYHNTRQYAAAFPVLRKITRNYPNTVWANQAYYYIGMCHFRMENWNKAVEALSLVGTFVDPDSESLEYIEAGHRLYLKVDDADLPVLHRLGERIAVELTTSSGDKEPLTCVPLSRQADVFIGSLPTKVAVASPQTQANGTLEVVAGDEITAVYIDTTTQSGEHRIERPKKTIVVSTGSVRFTLGTLEGSASAAFLGQPAFVIVNDADLDTSDQAEEVSIQVFTRYRRPDDDADESSPTVSGIDIDKLFAEEREQDRWVVRDEATVRLSEHGEVPVRTGVFAGQVSLRRAGGPVDRSDDALVGEIGDQLVAVYVDERHIAGNFAVTRESNLTIIGEIDGRPRATQNIVSDAIVRARKNTIEGEAFLELGRIFRDMGLLGGAAAKCNEGMEKVEVIIRSRTPIPTDLHQRAHQLKWELQMTKGDFAAAINTCEVFNRLYPDSPLVDEALKQIALVHMERKNYKEAIIVFSRILKLAKSQVKPEAAFRIAECVEAEKSVAEAIPRYQECAQRFPDSEFAGEALAKQIDYYVETRDLPMADELLARVFEEYPDALFLDRMLLKWVIVSFRRGHYDAAREHCNRLLFEYPSSRFAATAKKHLPIIERKAAGAKAE